MHAVKPVSVVVTFVLLDPVTCEGDEVKLPAIVANVDDVEY